MAIKQRKSETEMRVKAIQQIRKNASFKDLVAVAGLNPKQDFRYRNFSQVDFSGHNLDGFDFTGANLQGCNFENSLISQARFDAANLTEANLNKAKDWANYKETWKRSEKIVDAGHLRDLNVFQDAPFAPELVVIPPGSFLMGSADGEGRDGERPQHEVTIDYRFAVGRYPVTFEEWDFYVSRNPKAQKPKDEGWGRDRRPVINVSWDNAQGYVRWLSAVTGEKYRLLSETEWEYSCSAGTDTEYHFGDDESLLKDYGWYDENADGKTQPVGLKKPNQFGLYDVHGNVWEWCGDHWHESYEGAPSDGSARVEDDDEHTTQRVLRGGSWFNDPRLLRARFRRRGLRGSRYGGIGFRVARALASR